MLWESSKMEQRYDAVLGVIRDGFTVTEVAQKFGVSRQSVHTWMQRYEEGGLEALGALVAASEVAGRVVLPPGNRSVPCASTDFHWPDIENCLSLTKLPTHRAARLVG